MRTEPFQETPMQFENRQRAFAGTFRVVCGVCKQEFKEGEMMGLLGSMQVHWRCKADDADAPLLVPAKPTEGR